MGPYTPGVPMPTDVGVVDLMVGVPSDREGWQRQFAGLLRDRDSSKLRQPAGYMFKDLPHIDPDADFAAVLVAEMDRFGIDSGLIPVTFAEGDLGADAVRRYPHRLLPSFHLDPNQGMNAVRDLRRAAAHLGAVAATCFPAGLSPQQSPDAPNLYPLYATCVELGLPMLMNVGVPGPRFPMMAQHVEPLDRVCHDFPELALVTRHGAEPWTELMIELMRAHPGLHYSTSAFAPRHYPSDIVDYANADGRDKVMYAGYFPMGLTLERIFDELPSVGFSDDTWPCFLRDNARRVLGLE